MKILFLCHRFPLPSDGGGKIRSLHVLRHLLAAGHDVTLCSLIRSPSEARGAVELEALGARVFAPRVRALAQWSRLLLRLPALEPATFGYFWSRELYVRVRKLLSSERWDLILVHCSSMGPYVSGAPGVPKIMDFADMDSQKWLDYSRAKRFPVALLYALEGRKLERAELQLARAFDFCTTISVNELDTLNAQGSGTPADWFPNGVDPHFFRPPGTGYDPNLVVFVGRMDYYPNEQAILWFCDEVWPRVRERRATLRLKIVGADPPRSVRRLAGRALGVEVTGFVPDVRPHLAQAMASVAPLRIARGMQNKVLECMAMGVPAIASERVVRGLGMSVDSPVRVADTPDEYAEAILELAADPAARARLSSRSRAVANGQFSWSRAMQKLDVIIQAVASGGHREASNGTDALSRAV